MLHKAVDKADVILLVLDARDPAGCRSRLVEEEVCRREAEGKYLVFVQQNRCVTPILSPPSLHLEDHRYSTVLYFHNVDLVLHEDARHDSNTSATQLRRSHSALRVRISARTWHCPSIAPLPQGVQTERCAEHH